MPTLEKFCTDEDFARMKAHLEAHPDAYPVGSVGAGIFELTWRLLGMEETLMDMVADQDVIHGIFEKLTALLMQFVDKVCELPVEAVMLGDDWADQRGIMFGAERWREMIKPYYRRIYDYIHKKGKLTITHSCGSVREVIPDLIDAGLDVLESVQPEANGMEPSGLKREFGKELCFWGALGCQQAVTFFSPDELRAEIRRLKQLMAVGGGYVLAPSKTLNASIPIENAMVILEEFTGCRP